MSQNESAGKEWVPNCWRCHAPMVRGNQGSWMCDCSSTPFDCRASVNALASQVPAQPPAQGCPICGRYPITVDCVRDWLKAKDMPLSSEWQERLAQYANEIIKYSNSDEPELPRQTANGQWLESDTSPVPAQGTPPAQPLGTCSSQHGREFHTKCPECVGWKPAYVTNAPASPQSAETLEQPWLYAIAEPNGHWQDGESCVFQDLESCQSDVDQYNQDIEEGEPKYTVVPLYRRAALAESHWEGAYKGAVIRYERLEKALAESANRESDLREALEASISQTEQTEFKLAESDKRVRAEALTIDEEQFQRIYAAVRERLKDLVQWYPETTAKVTVEETLVELGRAAQPTPAPKEQANG